jgi:hypothetical protein
MMGLSVIGVSAEGAGVAARDGTLVGRAVVDGAFVTGFGDTTN